MKKFLLVFGLIFLMLSLAVFAQIKVNSSNTGVNDIVGISSAAGSKKLVITSESFKDGGKISVRHSYSESAGSEAMNYSPQFSWKTERKDIKSYALIMYDKHKIAKNWVHWCVTDIPAEVNFLDEGMSMNMPAGSITYFNTYGFVGYGGPNPPKKTGFHNYEIWIAGLNKKIGDVEETLADQKICLYA